VVTPIEIDGDSNADVEGYVPLNVSDSIVGGNQLGDTYTSGNWRVDDSQEYNVTVNFNGDLWTDDLKNDFLFAADYVSSIITNDVGDIPSFFGTYVDDLLLQATLEDIDGNSGVLGSTSITYVRGADGIPIEAIIKFDVADAQRFEDKGLWGDIVLHEMMHALGVGSLWSYNGLVDKSTSDWRYTGENAVNAYIAEMEAATNGTFVYDGKGIPVETSGGSGTAGKHWDEGVFDNELMTGYVDSENFFSDISIASLADLGYSINNDPDSWGTA
jgi:hypothetical protein